jgi:hypothetical protein
MRQKNQADEETKVTSYCPEMGRSPHHGGSEYTEKREAKAAADADECGSESGWRVGYEKASFENVSLDEVSGPCRGQG